MKPNALIKPSDCSVPKNLDNNNHRVDSWHLLGCMLSSFAVLSNPPESLMTLPHFMWRKLNLKFLCHLLYVVQPASPRSVSDPRKLTLSEQGPWGKTTSAVISVENMTVERRLRSWAWKNCCKGAYTLPLPTLWPETCSHLQRTLPRYQTEV